MLRRRQLTIWQFLFLLGTYGPLSGAFSGQGPGLLDLGASLAMPGQPGHAGPARPCRACLAISGYLRPGYLRLSLGRQAGLSQAISGYLRLSQAISGYLRLSQAISGYLSMLILATYPVAALDVTIRSQNQN